jgi:hypothetical protein
VGSFKIHRTPQYAFSIYTEAGMRTEKKRMRRRRKMCETFDD